MNPDMIFIDVHGLVEHDIARIKHISRMTTGVYDLFWSEPNSPVGKILLRRKPDVIISGIYKVDKTVLGVYHLRESKYGAPVYVREGFRTKNHK